MKHIKHESQVTYKQQTIFVCNCIGLGGFITMIVNFTDSHLGNNKVTYGQTLGMLFSKNFWLSPGIFVLLASIFLISAMLMMAKLLDQPIHQYSIKTLAALSAIPLLCKLGEWQLIVRKQS